MTRYNKLWGSLIGGALGIILMHFGVDADFIDPAFSDAIGTIIGSAFGTWASPPNT